MANYRRSYRKGGTFFFTVALADRKSDLLTQHINFLRAAIRDIRRRHPFEIVAWVVLPEHMHTIWMLPPDDCSYPLRWRLIKTAFSRQIPATEPRSQSRIVKSERGIWQLWYWEHTIRNQNDLIRHIDYVHYNPVKHGHVQLVKDWPYSTFHRFVENGDYTENWGNEE